ncbi:MAG TPA: tRNA pseudouridine(38-40) synthase TruA [Vicinamibacterales bacterium]|nr:tRNA pseudouridine(38-40) synthase TruA [Vicinamibacterales bacterium]
MPRFKLTIEYAGTRYSGWQIQKNAKTVQGEIDRALREVAAGRKFELYGSGRTDAGVHALAQVAHLDIAATLPPETLRRRLNDELPSDINVLAVETVTHRFHARHSAVARSYLYQIARRRTAFGKALVWWIREPIDLDRMRDAALLFRGLRDFQSFTEDDPELKSTKVQVDGIRIEPSGDLVLLRIEGSHFIWKMARRIVGVLAAVGTGDLTREDVRRFLEERSGTPAKLTAPASGLFLERVYYEGDRRLDALVPVLNLDPRQPT